MPYGTLTTLDTLAASNQTVYQIGENNAFEGLRIALEAHNRLLRESLADFVEDTTDRVRRWGANDDTEFGEVDQFGRIDVSKTSAGQDVGFPLRKYQRGLGWTRDYFEETTGAEFATQVNGILDADARNVYREIRRALFKPTNATFIDVNVDNVSIPVKALLNADSSSIPIGPSGTSFNGATHTHYLYTAGVSIAAADLTALIETVIEHYGQGMPIVEINRAQETAVRALTGFTPYVDARIIPATTGAVAQGVNLDPVNIYNRAIGVYGGAEVWVKTRVVAGYVLCWMKGVPNGKPLAYRRREKNPARGDLRLVAENESYPLRAQTREREFGLGVWERASAAVLYIDTGAAGAYVAPSIT